MNCRWRDKVLVRLLLFVLFLTTGLHLMISLDWSRQKTAALRSQFQEKNLTPETKQKDEDSTIKPNRHSSAIYGNGVSTSRRKPIHLESVNKSPQNNHSMQETGYKVQDIKGTVVQNNYDRDDEIGFWKCGGRGTFDISGYPLVDARSIYCGSFTDATHLQIPGAIQPFLILEAFEHVTPKTNKISSITIEEESRLITVNDVNVNGHEEFITCGTCEIKQREIDGANVEENRIIKLRNGNTFNAGPIMFFSPILSQQRVLMGLLRTLYTECAMSSKAMAITVKHASVDGKAIAGTFCIYLNAYGGGIKEAYVLWTDECAYRYLPRGLKRCVVNEAHV